MLASSAYQKIYTLRINNECWEMGKVCLKLTIVFYTVVVGHLGKEHDLEMLSEKNNV
jgi:hypothetical protein